MGLRGLQYRCRLCASVERWDLVAADVVAAFQWWFKACDDGTPSKAVIQAFGDLLTRLGRLPESQLASVFEALGTDNAAVVRDFLADVQRKSDKAGTDRPDR